MMNNKKGSRISKRDKEKLRTVKLFLSHYPEKHITIEQLAELSGLYRSKLTAMFKQVYGKSIYNYMLEVKMKKAKRLLLANDQPIKSIAGACGYKTVQSFSRVFKKYFGLSPSQFQKSQ